MDSGRHDFSFVRYALMPGRLVVLSIVSLLWCGSWLGAGGIFLDGYDPFFTTLVQRCNRQPAMTALHNSYGMQLLSFASAIGKAIENGMSGSGDALCCVGGTLHGAIRVTADFTIPSVAEVTGKSYMALQSRMRRCATKLVAMIVQPDVRMRCLAAIVDDPYLFDGAGKTGDMHAIEGTITRLLDYFYQATGYTISPFSVATQALHDPFYHFSLHTGLPHKSLLYLGLQKAQLSAAPEHREIGQNIVHCALRIPSLWDKLAFLERAIPQMSLHYKKIRCKALSMQDKGHGFTDSLSVILTLVDRVKRLLRSDAAKRRFRLYEHIVFDIIDTHNVTFVLDLLGLCICMEMHLYCQTAHPQEVEALYASLAAYASLQAHSDLFHHAITFNFENEFENRFFADDLAAKRDFIECMIDVFSGSYQSSETL